MLELHVLLNTTFCHFPRPVSLPNGVVTLPVEKKKKRKRTPARLKRNAGHILSDSEYDLLNLTCKQMWKVETRVLSCCPRAFMSRVFVFFFSSSTHFSIETQVSV